MQKKSLLLVLLMSFSVIFSQSDFDYHIQLTPISIAGFSGIQSFAKAQHDGKWIIIGGRLDGLHARQPFNAFPSGLNNNLIRVVDPVTHQQWTAPLTNLAVGLQEQLQSTNMNFYQDGNNLIIVGGYAYSATANNHITFNKVTIINLPLLVQYVIAGTLQPDAFYQLSDNRFAVTGGQLAKIDDTYYLVGGQRFDGRYNPMNNPTFTQAYTDSYKKFKLIQSNNQWQITDYEEVTDAVHLHRRDYNLVPQIYPDGSKGYMISSGVFQINANIPFLYPVDIKATGYEPQTNFNQLLSNYHGAHVELFSATNQKMHALFFGGLSQYYYSGSTLTQDTNVPFVKTISRVTRNSANELIETRQPEEMPIYIGAGSEFIPNHSLPHFENEVIKLDEITANEFVVGHIVGGIASTSQNPFTNNQTAQTNSSSVIYEVKLINQPVLNSQTVIQQNPFSFKIYPNPTHIQKVRINYEFPYEATLEYLVTDNSGKLIMEGDIVKSKLGTNSMDFELESTESQVLFITLIFDQKFYQTQKVILN
jgi:hypothetical protein